MIRENIGFGKKPKCVFFQIAKIEKIEHIKYMSILRKLLGMENNDGIEISNDIFEAKNCDKSFLVKPIEDLLQENSKVIKRIKIATGLSTNEFDIIYLPLIIKMSEYYYTLPASKNLGFSREGGLLEKSLNIGFFTLQSSEGKIFNANVASTNREETQDVWRITAFICGLGYELGNLLTQYRIISCSSKSEWNPLQESLYDYLIFNKLKSFQISWIENDKTSQISVYSLVILMSFLPTNIVTRLINIDRSLLEVVYTSIVGITTTYEAGLLHDLIKQTKQNVEAEYFDQHIVYSKVLSSTDITKYIAHVLKHIAQEWSINSLESLLWVTAEGIFIDWNNGYLKFIELLRKSHCPSFPENKSNFTKILHDSGFIRQTSSSTYEWTLVPNIPDTPKMARSVIFLRNHSWLTLNRPFNKVPIEIYENDPGILSNLDQTKPLEKAPVNYGERKTDIFISADSNQENKSQQNAENDKQSELQIPRSKKTVRGKIIKDTSKRKKFQKWCKSQGPLGFISEILVKKHVDQHCELIVDKGQLAIPYPKALSGNGLDVKVILQDLIDNDWIISVKDKPSRYIHTWRINNREEKVLVVNDWVSKVLLPEITTNETENKYVL